jgi:hypothetical protein
MDHAMSVTDDLRPLHPECTRMHRHGYCVCTMVECIWCEKAHPPHRPCERQEQRAGVEAVTRFLRWGADR